MTDFRSFHKLSYGLYIICSGFEGEKAGYAGNVGFQVTAEPNTIAISCNKDNITCGTIEKSKSFSLSVLQKDLDVSVIGTFGFKTSDTIDKFANVEYKIGETGVPIVTSYSVAAFECKVINQVDCGTHILFIGEVLNGEVLSDDDPLTYDYYHEHYKMLAPKNAPTYIDPEKLKGEPVAGSKDEKSKETDEEPHKHEYVKTEDGKYVCIICGYTYDPEIGEPSLGIPAGTPFEELPEEFLCPLCGAGKEYFNKI